MATTAHKSATTTQAHTTGHKGGKPTGAGGSAAPTRKPVHRPAGAAAVEIDVSACVTLTHALRGRRVECTIMGDPRSVHRRDRRVRGRLVGANSTVTIIDDGCWWTSNVKDLKETKK